MYVIANEKLFAVAGGGEQCTGVPDAPFGFNFSIPCANHDKNYTPGTTMSKSDADSQFRQDMKDVCATDYNNSLLCNITAEVYYIGVSIFGGFFYGGGGTKEAQQFDQSMQKLRGM